VAQLNIPWEEGTSDKNVVALRQRLKEIQQWRLNFANKAYRERFLLAAETVARQVSRENYKTYVDQIYALMIDWGAPPREMSVGA
jgi:hypothetical protein